MTRKRPRKSHLAPCLLCCVWALPLRLLLKAEPPGMQALDRASSAGNCGAGSSCSALGRATCRKRGTANTFDRMIPSARGSEEAAQCCSCGTAGSPPPCPPPEGACQELGIRGGAFQNGQFRRRGFSRTGRSMKSDFPEWPVLEIPLFQNSPFWKRASPSGECWPVFQNGPF